MTARRVSAVLAWCAVGWTLLAGAVLLLAPTGVESTVSSSPTTGEMVETTTHTTLLEHEGTWILYLLAIPVGLALIGVWRWTRLGAGVVLFLLCIPAALTIGIFYMPAAGLLLTAGIIDLARRFEARAAPAT